MKTAITSTGNSLKSLFDLRFGRASWFCIYDEEKGESTFYENEYALANSGAGGKVAEKMVELGIEKIVSGDFGPKAKTVLDQFDIQLAIIQDDNYTIEDVIDFLK